ncbi:MAG: NUDIX domain-containing protein [Flavobacteriaceae bacterium]|nr:NUDIX domain-containing protein [Flavobacteriaceae bacterium]
MDELIDILNKDGSSTGRVAPKSEVHTKGHYHNTVHIWFYTNDGEILLQQRSLNKSICPGLWDVSAAGHVDAGETIKEAALREVKEELGLDINLEELVPIGVFECFQTYSSGIQDNEFHNTFLCELKHSLSTVSINTEEVAGVKLVSVKDFKALLDNSKENNHFVETNKSYYLHVLEQVKNHLGNE